MEESSFDDFVELESVEIDMGEGFDDTKAPTKVDSFYRYDNKNGILYLQTIIVNKGVSTVVKEQKQDIIANSITLIDYPNKGTWENYALLKTQTGYAIAFNGVIIDKYFTERPTLLMVHLDNSRSLFVIKNTDKLYGIINRDSILLPFEYSALSYKANQTSQGFLFTGTKKGKTYIINSKMKIYSQGYENISVTDNSYQAFILSEKGKYGYADGERICEPIFNYKFGKDIYKIIDKYLVYKMVDNQGNFLGYADPDGYYYFEE